MRTQDDCVLTFVQTNVRIHDVVSPHLVEVRVVGGDGCLLTVTVIVQHVVRLLLRGGCSSSCGNREKRANGNSR